MWSVIGTILGGTSLISLLGFIVYFKPRLKVEKLEAKSKDVEVSTELLELTKGLSDRLVEKSNIITKMEQDRFVMNRRIQKQEYRLTENERKINGLEKAFQRELTRRREADKFVCFNTECEYRTPPMGTYDSSESNVNNKSN